eukprot:3805847-Prymnesium_polylepis.1
MAWQRVVLQHRSAPAVGVGGRRCTFRAPSGGPETVRNVRVSYSPRFHVGCDFGYQSGSFSPPRPGRVGKARVGARKDGTAPLSPIALFFR